MFIGCTVYQPPVKIDESSASNRHLLSVLFVCSKHLNSIICSIIIIAAFTVVWLSNLSLLYLLYHTDISSVQSWLIQWKPDEFLGCLFRSVANNFLISETKRTTLKLAVFQKHILLPRFFRQAFVLSFQANQSCKQPSVICSVRYNSSELLENLVPPGLEFRLNHFDCMSLAGCDWIASSVHTVLWSPHVSTEVKRRFMEWFIRSDCRGSFRVGCLFRWVVS